MPPNSKEYRKAYYKRRRKEVIKDLGSKCVFCGTIFDLEIDHKNGYNGKVSPNNSRGGMRNLFDAINLIKAGRKEELRVLCHKCNKAERKRGDKCFLKTSDYIRGLNQQQTELWVANILTSFLFDNIDVETGDAQ